MIMLKSVLITMPKLKTDCHIPHMCQLHDDLKIDIYVIPRTQLVRMI